ncbi:MAG: sodium-translocating pyrophosphatase [Candidatus Latescibacterota bacterium]|nr:MAG: sodium-translocating pyrophosphatase [Candidatus Latescibacterota bacterium]
MNSGLIQVIPWLGVLGMIAAVITFFGVRRHSPGNEKMQALADKIHAGAMVFLKREYQIIFVFMVIVFIALAILLSIWTGVAYLCGAICSGFAGWFGMEAATRSGSRACQAAKDGGTPKALAVAFQGGSVMGLTVAALGVIGLGFFFYVLHDTPTEAPLIINGFAMGASSIALFARVGGGIYTKSADVGADLVGKVEAGIPEDDPRNPGVIADNVGDNVGDTAGMGADLFESYVGSVVAAMAIGATFADPLSRMTLPLALIGGGMIASLIGVFSMGVLKKMNPQNALRVAMYLSGIVFIVLAFVLTKSILGELGAFWAVIAGLLCGILIGAESEYYTSGPPIREIARQSESGPATTAISGLAIGFKSAIWPMITICVAIFAAYKMDGLYGIAMAGVGMLSTIGIVMATDSYGPIADNAGGIAEMSGAGAEIRKITDRLDALGNTTAAIGKGFAIGSAAITALALFSAYQTTISNTAGGTGFSIDLTSPLTVIGLFLGAMMPFVIAALTMEAVGRAANKMVIEIRRQFREIKGLLEGKAEPQIDVCVDIVTKGALREMILPGIIAVAAPLIIGFLMGPEALGGFLAGATATGVLMGVFMANGGGAWDNAKKYIEEGHHGGKGSDAHKAAVVGDTIGDPFKDTSGPSMNILIKLMAVVSLVFAPIIARVL